MFILELPFNQAQNRIILFLFVVLAKGKTRNLTLTQECHTKGLPSLIFNSCGSEVGSR